MLLAAFHIKETELLSILTELSKKNNTAPMTTAQPNDNSVDESNRGVGGGATVLGTLEISADTTAGTITKYMQTKHALKYSDLINGLAFCSFRSCDLILLKSRQRASYRTDSLNEANGSTTLPPNQKAAQLTAVAAGRDLRSTDCACSSEPR
jgi:hypothetical protein